MASAGVLGVEQRPRFHSYVVEQRRPSYQYRDEGFGSAAVPEEGVTLLRGAAAECGARDYRYTVVNGRTSCWSNRAPTALSRSSSNPAASTCDERPSFGAAFFMPIVQNRPPVRISRTISNSTMALIAEYSISDNNPVPRWKPSLGNR